MISEKESNNRFCKRVRGAIWTAEKPGTKREISPISVLTECPSGAAAWRLDGENHIPHPHKYATTGNLGFKWAGFRVQCEQVSTNREQLNHWAIERPLQRRTVTHHLCKFGRKAGSASRAKPSPVHTKTGLKVRTEALDLPVHLLFLPLFSKKRRVWDEPLCHEFTNVEFREPLQRRFLKWLMVVLLTIGADCSYRTSKPAHMPPYLPTTALHQRPTLKFLVFRLINFYNLKSYWTRNCWFL